MKFNLDTLNNVAVSLLVMMGAVAQPSLLTPVGTPAVIPIRPGKTRYFDSYQPGASDIDHRAMERNKYAPWGRGVAGGAAV